MERTIKHFWWFQNEPTERQIDRIMLAENTVHSQTPARRETVAKLYKITSVQTTATKQVTTWCKKKDGKAIALAQFPKKKKGKYFGPF